MPFLSDVPLGALGAGAFVAPKPGTSILLDARGQFSNAKFDAAKKVPYDALALADKSVAEIKSRAQSTSGLDPDVRASLLRDVGVAQSRLALYRTQLDGASQDVNNGLWSTEKGSDGKTNYQRFIERIQLETKFADQDKDLLKLTNTNMLWDALLEQMKKMLQDLAAGGEGLLWLVKNAKWIALGAGALYLGIRTYRSYGPAPAPAVHGVGSLFDQRYLGSLGCGPDCGCQKCRMKHLAGLPCSCAPKKYRSKKRR